MAACDTHRPAHIAERVHGHGRGDSRHRGLRDRLRHLATPHSHDAGDSVDPALEASREGTRTVFLSLALLMLTAGLQAGVVALSGSVALLGDTLHNAADGLTALPLWMAFRLGRRPANDRFTYGYGKAEDIAGVAVVAFILASAALAGFQSVDRLLHPQPVTHLGWVMGAALVGAAGNEVVAIYRIRIGRRIGSAALVADGWHARTDGITSLLVLAGAVAVALGARWADPVVGLAITASILLVGARAARNVGQRLLDAVDPAIVAGITRTAAAHPGIIEVTEVRARWVGHRLFAQVRLTVAGDLSVEQAHELAESVHHALLHEVGSLEDAVIHVDPANVGIDPHHATAHHLSLVNSRR